MSRSVRLSVCLSVCLSVRLSVCRSQLMPLPLTVYCISKIQIGFAFLVPAHPGSPGQRAVKRVCVCVCSLSARQQVRRRLRQSAVRRATRPARPSACRPVSHRLRADAARLSRRRLRLFPRDPRRRRQHTAREHIPSASILAVFFFLSSFLCFLCICVPVASLLLYVVFFDLNRFSSM